MENSTANDCDQSKQARVMAYGELKSGRKHVHLWGTLTSNQGQLSVLERGTEQATC